MHTSDCELGNYLLAKVMEFMKEEEPRKLAAVANIGFKILYHQFMFFHQMYVIIYNITYVAISMYVYSGMWETARLDYFHMQILYRSLHFHL